MKKIVLPLADGGRQEIEVAEKARLDAIEAALAPNLLPGDGSGRYDTGERVSYGGFNSGGSWEPVKLCYLGPLKGTFTLWADFDTSGGCVLYVCDSEDGNGNRLLSCDGRRVDGEVTDTAELNVKDAWLFRSNDRYSWNEWRDVRLYEGTPHQAIVSIDNKIRGVYDKIEQRRIEDSTMIREVRNQLPWIGSMYDFKRFDTLESGKMYLVAGKNSIECAYMGGSRVFPDAGYDFRFSISGKFDPTTDPKTWVFRTGLYDYTCPMDYSNEETGEFRHNCVANVTLPFPKDYERLFSGNKSLMEIVFGCADAFYFKSARYMFYNCTALEKADLRGLNTSRVTNTTGMFHNCSKLQELNMSGWDTSKVTSMSSMFYFCSKLAALDLSAWDTSKVTSMLQMFYNCASLTELNLSGWDTSQVTTMYGMFYYCSRLTSLDLSSFDTSQVTNMSYMFFLCGQLTSLDLSSFDTSQVTNMSCMFSRCKAMTTLVLGNFNMAKVTNASGMFGYCTSLTDVTGTITGLSDNLDLGYSPLTNASAMVFINGLAEVTAARTITFSAATYDALTEEQIALATSRGWTVAKK